MSNWYKIKIQGVPKSEEICTRCYNEGDSELIFAITRDYKGIYKLYRIENNTATYTKKKSRNPLDFDDYIDEVMEKE